MNRAKAIAYQSSYQIKLRAKLVEILGGKCVRCGFSDIRALQIDHINGKGTEEYKRKGNAMKSYKRYLDDEEARKTIQILCANCNWIKRVEHREYAFQN